MESGLMGDAKALGDGLHERRLTIGSGLRIYFGLDGETLVILLGGGSKRRQSADIKAARNRWADYLSRKNQEA